MSRLIITVHAQCAPNRWPIRVVRVQTEITNPPFWVVEETDPDGEWEYTDQGMGCEYDTVEKAMKAYNERVEELRNEPNWEAQEAYDDEHGTINGYAPWQYEDREY